MAISVVQTQSSTTLTGSTVVVTLTSTGSQHTIIVAIGTNNVSAFATGVATSGGQNLVAAKQESDAAGSAAEIWYLDNIPSGQTSVTVTFAAAPSHVGVVAWEVAGVYATGGSLDKTSAAFVDGASPTSWTSGATATLSQASEIAIGSSAQIGIGVVTTGPGAFTNTNAAVSGQGVEAGYQIVSATTALTYAGSCTHSGTAHTSTAIATFKAGTPPPANAPSTFYPIREAKGRPAIQRGISRSEPGARYVAFPSAFTLPKGPSRGRQIAVRGFSRSEPGAKYTAFPSAFYAPHKPAKGAAGTRRGTSASSPGARYIHVIPPGPSPFTLPTGPAKGRSAIRHGVSDSIPGAPYFHISTFVLPTRSAKGAQIARRGSADGSAGAPYVTFPSPFTLPRTAAKGRSAIQRGRSESHAGARFVLIRISPFYAPHKPARGRPIAGRGKWSAGTATGQGAPPVPRQLIISLASAAGVDDYGNAYPQGIYATAGVIEGPTIISSDAFYYDPEPGAGNLVSSVTSAGGTDEYGNVYLAGTVSYLPTSGLGSAFACQIANGGVLFYASPTEAGPWTEQAGLSFGGIGSGQLGFITQGGSGGGVIPQTGVPETTAGIYAALFAAGIFA